MHGFIVFAFRIFFLVLIVFLCSNVLFIVFIAQISEAKKISIYVCIIRKPKILHCTDIMKSPQVDFTNIVSWFYVYQ